MARTKLPVGRDRIRVVTTAELRCLNELAIKARLDNTIPHHTLDVLADEHGPHVLSARMVHTSRAGKRHKAHYRCVALVRTKANKDVPMYAMLDVYPDVFSGLDCTGLDQSAIDAFTAHVEGFANNER